MRCFSDAPIWCHISEVTHNHFYCIFAWPDVTFRVTWPVQVKMVHRIWYLLFKAIKGKNTTITLSSKTKTKKQNKKQILFFKISQDEILQELRKFLQNYTFRFMATPANINLYYDKILKYQLFSNENTDPEWWTDMWMDAGRSPLFLPLGEAEKKQKMMQI